MIRSAFRKALVGAGCLLLPAASMAVPAMPLPVEMRQPDGTVFEGRLRGDEFAGWREDGEGRAVVRNPATGWWEYGALSPDRRSFLPTGRIVNPAAEPPADIPLHVAPARDIGENGSFRRLLESAPTREFSSWDPPPLTGERKVLVILVEFTDRALTSTPDAWGAKIFGLGAADESVAKFYLDNSYGQFTIAPAAHFQPGLPQGVVRVSLDIPHPDYGGDITEASEIPWLNLALQKAVFSVDFTSFDTNHDRIVDSGELTLYFVAAGYESSAGNGSPDIWAHAVNGYEPGITPGSNLFFRQWAVQGELFDDPRMMGIGAFTHELGHSLCGLPDLYDVSYTNAGLGAYSLMAMGSWGFTDFSEIPGETPVALDAWSRENLSWGTAMTAAPGLTLPAALSETSTFLKLVNDEKPDEYWLVENRRPLSWDRGIWGVVPDAEWFGGVLILHVNNAVGTNEYAAGRPQGVMAEEASSGVCSPSTPSPVLECVGAQSNFFYSGNNDTFGPNSVPSSRYHDGSHSGFELSSISSPADVMTASLMTNVGIIPDGLGRAFGGDGGGGGGLCFLASVVGEDRSSVCPLTVLLALGTFAGVCAFIALRRG